MTSSNPNPNPHPNPSPSPNPNPNQETRRFDDMDLGEIAYKEITEKRCLGDIGGCSGDVVEIEWRCRGDHREAVHAALTLAPNPNPNPNPNRNTSPDANTRTRTRTRARARTRAVTQALTLTP